MYVDARPASTFKQNAAWNMPRLLKQPPAGNSSSPSSVPPNAQYIAERPESPSAASSQSSFANQCQAIPSFQTFLRQTPPLEHDPNKPLPPTPSVRNDSPASADDSIGRRSSSVYSRTPSQWATDSNRSWRTEDLDDDFPLAHHRPIAYSISTPDLQSRTSGQLLEPRVFSPLINTPSPTLSAVTDPASPPHSRPITTLLPPSPPSILSPLGQKKKIETVSLEKAKEARDAPGAVRLLPEELRAQTVGRAGYLRMNTLEILGGAHTPLASPLFTVATLVDNQGRQRLLSTPLATPPVGPSHQEFPFPAPSNAPYDNALHVGTGPMRPMAPPVAERRRQSKDDGKRGSIGENAERGRRKERGRKSRGYTTESPKAARRSSSVGTYHFRSANEPRDIADELAQRHRPFESQNYDSDDSIRRHMKMVPQPLFMGKQPARKSGTLRGSPGSPSSGSTLHRKTKSEESIHSSKFPLRISPTPPSSYNRGSEGSTTGMIPISPPTNITDKSPQALDAATSIAIPRTHLSPSHKRKQKQDGQNSRGSQFYPHIMRRASSKKNELKKAKASIDENAETPQLPGLKLLPPEFVAAQMKTPVETSDVTPMSPLGSNPVPFSLHKKTPSNGSSDKSKKTFYERVKGATRHGRRRSSDLRDISPSSSKASPLASKISPTSPHLVKPHEVSLGWSDASKQDFDDASTPPRTPIVTHAALPARPLDGRKAGSSDEVEGSSGSRRPGLFGTFQARWNENKAERRRYHLKKSITVVPNSPIPSGDESEGGGSAGGKGGGYKWM